MPVNKHCISIARRLRASAGKKEKEGKGRKRKEKEGKGRKRTEKEEDSL
jgi:hypothetical protein